ncbi:MAG: ABC transporter permease [Deltaproteobacteria bacterium]|nr:MAG: ABC transporter permease [Deltaproteobacteria bacterium]
MSVVGRASMGLMATLGGATMLLGRILRALLPPRFDRDEAWRQLYAVGVKSSAIVMVTALFVGAIMVIQTAFYVQRTGATSLLGFGVGFTVFAEIGPILIGLMFSGRVGANNTAELGTMVVTEQVDALRALAIDPIGYLVVPRFIAMIVMMLMLMALGDVFAIIGAALTADTLVGVDPSVLIGDILDSHLLDEYLLGLGKAFCFGVSISVLSCWYGLGVRGGATGVGRAVNNSVVANAAAIFFIDFVMGWIFPVGL